METKNAEIETETIETPIGKHKVQLKSWITGRDRRELRSVYLEEAEFGVSEREPQIKGLTGKIVEKAEDKAIEVVVVSVDGSRENVVKRVLDMRDEDYEFVMRRIHQITKEKKTG